MILGDVSLLNLLPPLRRARGDRLYDTGERHWVDLWKENGAWLFGHRPLGAAHEWKIQLDKGLSALLPSRWPARLAQHVKGLFPDAREILLFRNSDRLFHALENHFQRPLNFVEVRASFVRPFDEEQTSSNGLPGVRLPLLPSGLAQASVLVLTALFPESHDLKSDLVSPAEAGALVRSAVSLRSETVDEKKRQKTRSFWKDFDQSQEGLNLFHRHGPYLDVLCEPEDYESLFKTFLEAGFLLSPDPSLPSILPWELSEGELKAFRKAADVVVVEQEKAWNS